MNPHDNLDSPNNSSSPSSQIPSSLTMKSDHQASISWASTKTSMVPSGLTPNKTERNKHIVDKKH